GNLSQWNDRGSTGIVHQHVDSSPPVNRLVDDGRGRAVGANIGNGPGLTAQFLDASYWRAFSPSLIVELVRPPIRVVHVYRAARLTGAETSALPL
ncbi:MAG TPA: hypothetical protein VF926_09660, partial [Mycobacterium sp.]